ncbi:holin [Pseudoclavibacter sp. 8L]|uniref:holin n=1 Tax=Pseudoclavibacter sp. 8L TaxID=2653162 RepID=UPI0012F42C7F|nr:holin [Pseudoclavibacter sp. 8L]VXB29041.1 conserved hypothetical protein [Pseudoclavibacter sp. 8L]
MSLISEPETHGERTTKLASDQSDSTIWTAPFWRGTGERALKTATQVAVAAITVSTGADLIPAVGVEGINWAGVASVTAVATILSLFTSLGNASFTAGR